MMPTPSARLEAQLPGHPADQATRRLACRETLDKLGFDRAEPGCVDYPLLACHPATSLAQPGMGGLDDRLAHATCDDREGPVLEARHISELLLSFSAPPLGRRPTKGIREVHGRQFAAEEAASPDFSQRNVARNSCDEVLAPIHGEPAHRTASRRSDGVAPGRPPSATKSPISTSPVHIRISEPAVRVVRHVTPRCQSIQIGFQSLVGIFHPP